MAGRSYNKLRATYPTIVALGSETWDPGIIADGNEEMEEVAATGALMGDFVMVSHSTDTLDLTLSAQVTAADVVTVIAANNTGGNIDVTSGTLRVIVFGSGSGT